MKNKKLKIGFSDIFLLISSAFFLIGILTVFAPCISAEDSGWMSCHWAGNAVAGLAAIITVIAIIHLFVCEEAIKIGLDLAIIPIGILSAIIPENLIRICMISNMRCHSVMRPADVTMSVLIIFVAIIDIIIQRKKYK